MLRLFAQFAALLSIFFIFVGPAALQEMTPSPDAEETAAPEAVVGRAPITVESAPTLTLLGRMGSGRFTRIEIAPNGTMVGMLAINGVYIYTLNGTAQLTLIDAVLHSDFMSDFAWSADGTRVAAISANGLVTVHTVGAGGAPIASSTFDRTMQIALHPTAPVIAAAGDNRAVIWNYETNATLELENITFIVTALAFSPEGDQLLIGGGTTVIRYDNLAETVRNEAMPGLLFDLAYSPITRDTVVIAMDGLADVIRREGDSSVEVPFRVNGESARAVAFSPDGTRVIEGWSHGLAFVRDVNTGTVIHTLEHEGRVRSVDVAPDGTIWVFDQTSTLSLWNPDTGESVGRFPVGPISFTSLAIHPNGRLAAVGSLHDRSIYLFDLTTLGNAGTLVDGRGIRALAFSPDGARLVSSGIGDTALNVWDMTTGTLLGQLATAHTGPINALAFSSNGSALATGGDDGRVQVFNASNGGTIIDQTLGSIVVSVGFTPDDRFLIIGLADRRVLIVQTADWTLASQVDVPFDEALRSVVIDSRGELLLAAGTSSGNWFTLAPGERQSFNPAWGGLSARTAALAPDAPLFALTTPQETAAVSDDVRLFAFTDDGAQRIAVIQSPMTMASAVAFTPDSSLLIVVGIDGYIDVYGLR